MPAGMSIRSTYCVPGAPTKAGAHSSDWAEADFCVPARPVWNDGSAKFTLTPPPPPTVK